MSASIAFALSASANTSLIEATQATNCLADSSSECRPFVSASEASFKQSVNETVTKINNETLEWKRKYREIDNSVSPESFFSTHNMKQLKDADLLIRSFEEILRVQTEALLDTSNEVKQSIRELRISVAKLRMSISNVLKIEKQLRNSEAIDKSSFDMSVSAVQLLKTATKNAYMH